MILSAIFDSRELAVVAWLTILAACLVAWPKTRPGIGGILKAAASRQMSSILGLMAAYVAAVVFGLLKVGIWSSTMIGGSVFWFFGPATVLFFRIQQAGKDPHFFRRVVRSTLTVTAVVGFLVNFYPLSFLAEFLLLPVFALLGCLIAVSGMKLEFKPVRTLLNGFVTMIALGFVVYTLARAIQHPSGFLTVGTIQGFLLPIVLTVAFVPFLYALASFMVYDGLFTWLRAWLLRDHDKLRRRTRRRLVRVCGLRLRTVRRAADAPWVELLSDPPTDREVDQVVRHIKSGQPNALATPVSAEDTLARLAKEQVPGWEFMFLAERLKAGEFVLAARHDAFECEALPASFEKTLNRTETGKALDEKMHTATEVLQQLEVAFAEDALTETFGAPGEPGDPDRIRIAAETIITVYDRMLTWAETVGAMNTIPECKPLVHAVAQLMRQPLDEIRTYIDDWSPLVEDLPQRIEAAKRNGSPVRIEKALVLTIDPRDTRRVKKEVARLVQS
jgi:hypothetical protein